MSVIATNDQHAPVDNITLYYPISAELLLAYITNLQWHFTLCMATSKMFNTGLAVT